MKERAEVAQKEGECLAHAGTFWVIAERMDEDGRRQWQAFPACEMTLSSVIDVAGIFGGKVCVAAEIEPDFRGSSQKSGHKDGRQSAQRVDNKASVAGQDADC